MKKIFLRIILAEYAYFASLIYRKFRPYVIGITGSSGKTTTKNMIFQLLDHSGVQVKTSPGNMNTETGLPLAVLGFKNPPKNLLEFAFCFIVAPFKYILTISYPKYLVLEYAADKKNDISYLCKIIPPDISIITTIGVAHLEKFKTAENIIKEKWDLALHAKEYIVCTDQVYRVTINEKRPKAKVYKTGENINIQILNSSFSSNSTNFDLKYEGEVKKMKYSYLGEHNLLDLELALNCIYLLGGNYLSKALQEIKNLGPTEGRGERFKINSDTIIIDDSYNANPESMLVSLSTLKDYKYGRKVAILGQMAELGTVSHYSHKKVANYAKSVADLTVGVGTGFSDENLDKHYTDVKQLIDEIDQIIKKGDIVLVKGSHSNQLDKLVEYLKTK